MAALQAVQLVGLPEGRIPLAQAVVHLALAPKSNAVIRAIDAAVADVQAGHGGAVPAHLRDSHYAGAQRIGHGKGYVYPHDQPTGVAEQEYAPQDIAERRYYAPGDHGAERELAARLERLRAIVHGADPGTG